MVEIFGRWQYLVVISLRRMVSRGNQPKFKAFGPVKYVVTERCRYEMGYDGTSWDAIHLNYCHLIFKAIDVWMCLA